MRKCNSSNATPRLMSRWVMLLASNMMEKEGLDRSLAMTRAHLTANLLDKLGKGIVCFSYIKENGNIRYARGTLCRGVSKGFDSYLSKGVKKKRDNSNTDGVYVYWDLDWEEFRSFKASHLLNINPYHE